MAVTYQSHANSGTSLNQTSIVVSKPSGLAAGDLMVAFLTILDGASSIDVTSGWTDSGVGEISGSSAGSTMRSRIIYKIASSGDAAATNFTFTLTGGNTDFVAGMIYRINGHNPNNQIDGASGSFRVDTSSPSHSTVLTPTYANELLLFFTSWVGGTGVSSQAISVSNPSWTEDVDSVSTLGMATAHASRTQTTGLGDMTCTIDGGSGSSDSVLIMVVIKDKVDATIDQSTLTPAIMNATGAVLTPTITGGMTATPTTINATGAVLTPTIEEKSWRKRAKSSPKDWTPRTKS